MSTRRTTAPRKRPGPPASSFAAVASEEPTRRDRESDGVSTPNQQEKLLLEELESTLREQFDAGDENADLLLENFREAIESAQIEPTVALLDRKVWLETIDALARTQEISDSDRDELIREYDEAFRFMEDHEVKIALEFAQRIQRDGREKALEWFNKQQAKGSEPDTPDLHPSATSHSPQAITKSKSRRLRGPPRV